MVTKSGARADDRATSGIFLAIIGALSMLPPLAVDASLPGLPRISHDLHASAATVQATLSAFIAAFGLGQLLTGPLSDRFGRRPVLLSSMALFAAISVACALCGDGTVLVGLRFLQGLAASAGSVCARAVVEDVSTTPATSLRLQSLTSALGNLGPLLGPILGAAIVLFASWRWIFGALAIAGVVLFAAVVVRLPETLTAAAPGSIDRQAVLRPKVLWCALTIFFAFAGYFALITGSSLILVEQFGLGVTAFALAFALNALAAIAGSAVAARWSRRFSPRAVLQVAGLALFCVAAAGGALDTFAPAVVPFVAFFAAYGFLFGLMTPAIFSRALEDAGSRAGTLAGVIGASLSLGGAAGSWLAGFWPLPPAAAAGLTSAIAAAIAAVAAYGASRSRLQPAVAFEAS